MIVDVQKPIQSLHAFMRHHVGEGERNGSSPIFFRMMMAAAMISSIGMGTLSAQDGRDSHVQVQEKKDEKQLDFLFDRILQALPEGERTKVDSAATVKIDRKNITGPSGYAREHEAVITPRERLKELPDELKVQVERAISDMEQRKEDRKAQFRESLRNR